MSAFTVHLEEIQTLLNSVVPRQNAAMRFHGGWDAVVWSDEVPSSLWDNQYLIYLLRYRTSVLLGEPMDAVRPLWEEAQQMFSSWAGFAWERCTPDDRMRLQVAELKRGFETSLWMIGSDDDLYSDDDL